MSVYLGLGSNIGNREHNLRSAISALDSSEEISIIRQSRFYETPPWGDTDQRTFLNAVVEVKTTLSPPQLLSMLKNIEHNLGRLKTRRWGPRTIDLDILLFNDLVLKTSELIIPHPHLHERAFVLVPLLEIAPQLRDPATGTRYKDYLQHLPEKNSGKVYNAPDSLLRNR